MFELLDENKNKNENNNFNILNIDNKTIFIFNYKNISYLEAYNYNPYIYNKILYPTNCKYPFFIKIQILLSCTISRDEKKYILNYCLTKKIHNFKSITDIYNMITEDIDDNLYDFITNLINSYILLQRLYYYQDYIVQNFPLNKTRNELLSKQIIINKNEFNNNYLIFKNYCIDNKIL